MILTKIFKTGDARYGFAMARFFINNLFLMDLLRQGVGDPLDPADPKSFVFLNPDPNNN